MKKTRYAIYNLTNIPDLFKMIAKRKIHIEWVVEAGCHDGSDTIKFVSLPKIRKIYAFEPDSVARQAAESNCKQLILSNILTISPFALQNENSEYFVLSNGGAYGTGSSQVVDMNQNKDAHPTIVQGKRLDELIENESEYGLLWLDVEGSALEVLQGSQKILSKIKIIKVEVEFQDMWGRRKSNFESVINYLQINGFCLMYAPIYPGLFGDLLFLRKNDITRLNRCISFFLRKTILVLHKYLFRLTHKRKFENS